MIFFPLKNVFSTLNALFLDEIAVFCVFFYGFVLFRHVFGYIFYIRKKHFDEILHIFDEILQKTFKHC